MQNEFVRPIGCLIKEARQQHSLTQQNLADSLAEVSGNCSVTREQVARWERGRRIPGPYWREWLSITLDIPAEQLVCSAAAARLLRVLECDRESCTVDRGRRH